MSCGQEELPKPIPAVPMTCEPEPIVPSAFTISKTAITRMLEKKSDQQKPPTPAAIKTQMLESLEEKWQQREKCVEETHELATSLFPGTLDELEQNIQNSTRLRFPFTSAEPVIECYKKCGKSTLSCQDVVRKYESWVADTREKIAIRRAGQMTTNREKTIEDLMPGLVPPIPIEKCPPKK